MRNRLLAELGDLPHRRFLVYLMGPYQAFDVERVVDAMDPASIPESVDFGTLTGTDRTLDHEEAALDLLLDVRDRLRADSGVNAFLTIDVDVPLSELDAATQSIAFARASNAVIYVVPAVGDNLGVGIEVGAVLEALFAADEPADRRERVAFVHESGVRSAMIAAVHDRWEARVYTYEDRTDLVRQVRLFVRDLMRKERLGDLPPPE